MFKNKQAREAKSKAVVDVKNNSNQILIQKFEKEWAAVLENVRPLSDQDFISFDQFVEIMSLMYFTEPPSQQDSEEQAHKQVLFELYSNLYQRRDSVNLPNTRSAIMDILGVGGPIKPLIGKLEPISEEQSTQADGVAAVEEATKVERLSPELVLRCKLTLMRHRTDTLHELALERARLKYKPREKPTFRP